MRTKAWAVAVGVALLAGTVLTTAIAAVSITSVRFGDGTHRVGRDIPARTYRAARPDDGCYWARLRNFSGNLNAILANENASGPTLVTLKPTDKGFETARCGPWTSSLARITKSRTRFGEGTYIVGTDIAPGTYSARGAGCYWARLRAFTGELSAIIANDNATGRTIVTISRGDRGFTSSRCGTWSR
jgi:hypothetical protein